jgi:hypothetical protein
MKQNSLTGILKCLLMGVFSISACTKKQSAMNGRKPIRNYTLAMIQMEVKAFNNSLQFTLIDFSGKALNYLIPTLIAIIFISCQQKQTNHLSEMFQNPPDQYKPWLYWYWIDENISREGITKDLEAMARVGIGQALIGHVSPGGQRGEVKILSDSWWGMVEHAVTEGQRLGVDIGFFNGPGWSQSGGPWIKKDNAMRHIVSHEINVSGPTTFNKNISHPDTLFELVAIQAFPANSKSVLAPDPQINQISSRPLLDGLKALTDKNKSTHLLFPESLRDGQDLRLDISLNNPATVHAIQFEYLPIAFMAQIEVQSRESNGDYTSIRSFTLDRRYINFEIGPMRYQPTVISLPETHTSQLRIVFSNLTSDRGAGLQEIIIKTEPVIDQVIEKQLGKMYSGPLPPWDGYLWDEQPEFKEEDKIDIAKTASKGIIDPSTVIDLASKIDKDGLLKWEVPEGDWTILYSGMVPTGATNVPAPPEATGYECDKFTNEAIELHFNSFIGDFLQKVPPEKRQSLKTVVIDSYEVGPQNWTNDFRDLFFERYGYDPILWMPVFTGKIVESVDKSNRFLWDVRRLTADLIANVYVNRLRELCNHHGLDLWLENYGHWGFPAEFLQYGGQADKVSGEFWYENTLWDLGPLECRAASSAAHIYGKKQVFAEAFTAGFNFKQFPAIMKPRGDQMFCEGINHMVQHVYIHQPWEDRIPGVIAWFGMSYQRHNTWFEQSRAWNDYLSRCHLMLQQGLPVTDICYFIGEDAPKMTGILKPDLPAGYDYDFVNRDVVMTRMTVQDGRLMLPDGKSYELMVLPPLKTMRPELLKKIKELLKNGARIYGPPPIKSPSLEHYPYADEEVVAMSKELWEITEYEKEVQREIGLGHLFYGQPLPDVLSKLDIGPDVIVQDTSIRWTHRYSDETDIYFISNQSDESKMVDISFRVNGKLPELWHPDNGNIELNGFYHQENGRTLLPLKLDPHGSIFVVFRKPANKPSIRTIERNGQDLIQSSQGGEIPAISMDDNGNLKMHIKEQGDYELLKSNGDIEKVSVPNIPAPYWLNENWEVRFPENWDVPSDTLFSKLISWADHSHLGIKHFSGTAIYQNTFQISSDMILPGMKIMLDLGEVMIMAEIIVNGQNLGVLWKKPYAIDITDAVRQGENDIRIHITNTWWNRLVGDEKYPEGFPERMSESRLDKPRTFTTYKAWKWHDDLMPSGLLGPVQILFEKQYDISSNF